jgi:hypothetical protein
MKVYIAHWYDPEDKMSRVAGVYLRRKSAECRVELLGSGGVQAVILGRPVLFTHECGTEKK